VLQPHLLGEGKNIPNTLLLLSQNATLVEGSSVDGSVIMYCCNMTVDGKVNGDVYLLTGNLTIDVLLCRCGRCGRHFERQAIATEIVSVSRTDLDRTEEAVDKLNQSFASNSLKQIQ
jgi:hypothetical protein